MCGTFSQKAHYGDFVAVLCGGGYMRLDEATEHYLCVI